MSPSTSPSVPWLHVVLGLIFFACLWVGWRDHEWLTVEHQQEIRDSIRWGIRRTIQIAVQFVIPLAILGYAGRKLLIRLRGGHDER